RLACSSLLLTLALLLGDQISRVQPTFLLRGFFPPPAAFAFVLVRQHRAGAGLAANADKTALVQAVVGQLEHADVPPDFFAAHLRQRVELVQRPLQGGEGGIDFQRRYRTAGARALVPALACGPSA